MKRWFFPDGEWSFGWREGLIGLIVLIACYMLFELLRLRWLRRRRGGAQQDTREPSLPVVEPAQPSGEDEPVPTYTARGALETPEPTRPQWDEGAFRQANEAFKRSVEYEMVKMRDDLDAMRRELAAMREQMKQETARIKAAQVVSPIYGEAMQMAMMGHAPDAIAERCGIARAEADLVVALVNAPEQ